MKKFVILLIAVIVGLSLTACSENITIDSNTIETTSLATTSTTEYQITEEEPKPEYKSLFVDYFKKQYPVIEEMVLTGENNGSQYYQSTEGEIYFNIGENSVEFTDWTGKYIKEAAYFGNISSLTKGQKVRIVITDGFSSFPTLEIEQLFNRMFLLIKVVDEECDYSYTDIDLNLFSSKNNVGGKYYEYAFSDKLTFMIEESIDNGVIESRTLYCDIY